MECQAHHEENRRGDGGYPAAALAAMEQGGSPLNSFPVLSRELFERTAKRGVSDDDLLRYTKGRPRSGPVKKAPADV
jgi:hypothetical protein